MWWLQASCFAPARVSTSPQMCTVGTLTTSCLLATTRPSPSGSSVPKKLGLALAWLLDSVVRRCNCSMAGAATARLPQAQCAWWPAPTARRLPCPAPAKKKILLACMHLARPQLPRLVAFQPPCLASASKIGPLRSLAEAQICCSTHFGKLSTTAETVCSGMFLWACQN